MSAAVIHPIAPREPMSQHPPSLPKPTKRKRTDTPEGSSPDAASPTQRKARDGPKKKKASRACFHCQKAHLTCDDSRPCQRCIKRGLATNCTEGHRKKAKYLLDEEELDQLKRNSSKSNAANGTEESTPAPPTATTPPAPIPTTDPFPQTDTTFVVPFDPNFPFGSEAANLEYSILSAILGNPSPPDSEGTPPSQSYSAWPATDSIYPTLPELSAESALTTSPSTTASTFLTYPYQEQPRVTEVSELQYSQAFQDPPPPPPAPTGPLHPLQPRFPLDNRPRSPASFLDDLSNDHSSTSSCQVSKLQGINDRITKPYDYTQGYHFLMNHLRSRRFEKNDILRIVRALAIFRPSLIALQMPLSLDDEIFVEKCFQRSLLELDKLISFSGTPTVVWRRTGEIVLVSPEFCMLTEWSMEDLLGKKKYIYELFENQSVVEYWENFASHAFENTTQSVYSHCVLLKPSGAPIPSTFCFSLRRDLFDLPSAVIGQWLPLL